MTHEQFKEALNEYSTEKQNKMETLLISIEKLTMEELLYVQHHIAQTIVFFNVQRKFNLQKSENDVKELI